MAISIDDSLESTYNSIHSYQSNCAINIDHETFIGLVHFPLATHRILRKIQSNTFLFVCLFDVGSDQVMLNVEREYEPNKWKRKD